MLPRRVILRDAEVPSVLADAVRPRLEAFAERASTATVLASTGADDRSIDQTEVLQAAPIAIEKGRVSIVRAIGGQSNQCLVP
jgi:hypothetical protein